MRCVLEYESFDKEGIAAVSTDKERYDSVGSRLASLVSARSERNLKPLHSTLALPFSPLLTSVSFQRLIREGVCGGSLFVVLITQVGGPASLSLCSCSFCSMESNLFTAVSNYGS